MVNASNVVHQAPGNIGGLLLGTIGVVGGIVATNVSSLIHFLDRRTSPLDIRNLGNITSTELKELAENGTIELPPPPLNFFSSPSPPDNHIKFSIQGHDIAIRDGRLTISKMFGSVQDIPELGLDDPISLYGAETVVIDLETRKIVRICLAKNSESKCLPNGLNPQDYPGVRAFSFSPQGRLTEISAYYGEDLNHLLTAAEMEKMGALPIRSGHITRFTFNPDGSRTGHGRGDFSL